MNRPSWRWYHLIPKKARVKRTSETRENYWTHVSDQASLASWALDQTDSLLSIETLASSTSTTDIKSFVQNNLEKTLQLLSHLRVEFQELFLEYYLLDKSQAFLGKTHGFIQTRTWQKLRIIEQAFGAMLVLGEIPTAETLYPILEKAGLEQTQHGSLTGMIVTYAKTQSYSAVAEMYSVPVPIIRKLFRPLIKKLVASKDLKESAVGCYLRHLTHQASLTKSGLSKSAIARVNRVKTQHFDAPARGTQPLLNYNKVEALGDTPWVMFEISSDSRMAQLSPVLGKFGKRIFGKNPSQIFAPLDADGELLMGYIFARSLNNTSLYKLQRLRGIAELSATYADTGQRNHVNTVPNAGIQPLISKALNGSVQVPKIKVGDFVKVLTGDAEGYCGTVSQIKKCNAIVKVYFPSGRKFVVKADRSAVEPIATPAYKRTFWGGNVL